MPTIENLLTRLDPDHLVAAAFGVVERSVYGPDHVEADLELFRGRTGQYVFISSASVYKKPVDNWPITEATPLHNPFWEYSRNKIACENLLKESEGLEWTIVRPSRSSFDPIFLARSASEGSDPSSRRNCSRAASRRTGKCRSTR